MDLIEKSWQYQREVEERLKQLGKGRYSRVLKMARKPSSTEYKKTLQITGLGVILIGALGFLIYWVWNKLPGFFK